MTSQAGQWADSCDTLLLMPKVTLSMTEKEARVFIRALDIAASYMNSGEPFDGIVGGANLTEEETEALRAKMQARSDAFTRKLNKKPNVGNLPIEPIDWPPTDEDLIEYLSGALEQQLPEDGTQ
jgi:hypothetical protein